VKVIKKANLSDSEFQETVMREVETLEMLREANHKHLIRAIAYYTWRTGHFLMFPWAELGNLREFWKTDPPKLTPAYLEWVLRQLCGLADAIEKLHHAAGESSWRHGDMKPENILCFEEAGTSSNGRKGPCTLVISDVGLTKVHHKVTEARKDETRTQTGTIMYEPPETEQGKNGPRSRRYDIWSIGCIYLEFAIWLLYGSAELERFRRELGEDRRFYSTNRGQKAASSTPQLHSRVQRWVDWIRDDDRCTQDTAMRHLVELIVTRLLVPQIGRAADSRPKKSMLQEAQRVPTSARSEDAPSMSPMIFRVSTSSSYFNFPEGSLYGNRANAKQVNEKIQQIYKDATSQAGNRIEWIDMDAPDLPIRKGPSGQYGQTLGPSDTGLQVKSCNGTPEVC
jgi:serine/threonine protein kinase